MPYIPRSRLLILATKYPDPGYTPPECSRDCQMGNKIMHLRANVCTYLFYLFISYVYIAVLFSSKQQLMAKLAVVDYGLARGYCGACEAKLDIMWNFVDIPFLNLTHSCSLPVTVYCYILDSIICFS